MVDSHPEAVASVSYQSGVFESRDSEIALLTRLARVISKAGAQCAPYMDSIKAHQPFGAGNPFFSNSGVIQRASDDLPGFR